DEAGRVVTLILDVRRQRLEAIDLAGQPGRERSPALVRPFRDLARRAGRIARDDRLELQAADNVAALAERMSVAIDASPVLDAGAGNRQQLKVDRQERLAQDVEPGRRQKRMDVGDASGDRVLDWNHGEFGAAVLYGREGVLEGRAWQRLQVGKIIDTGDVRIGAGLALISN